MGQDNPRSTIILAAKSAGMEMLKESVAEKLRHKPKKDRVEFWEQNFEDELAERLGYCCFEFFGELKARFPDGDFNGSYRADTEATAGFDSSYVPFFYDHQTQLETGLKKLEDGNYLVGVGFRERDAGKPVDLDERQSAFRAARRQEMAEGLSTYLAWRCEKDGHVVGTRQGNPIPYGVEPECPLDRFAEAYEAFEKL